MRLNNMEYDKSENKIVKVDINSSKYTIINLNLHKKYKINFFINAHLIHNLQIIILIKMSFVSVLLPAFYFEDNDIVIKKISD
jgi:hypothetical protein